MASNYRSDGLQFARRSVSNSLRDYSYLAPALPRAVDFVAAFEHSTRELDLVVCFAVVGNTKAHSL